METITRGGVLQFAEHVSLTTGMLHEICQEIVSIQLVSKSDGSPSVPAVYSHLLHVRHNAWPVSSMHAEL